MPATFPALYGVVPILLTPFDDDGAIDESSLRNEVDFAIESGAHGLGIALGSEIYKLTEAERDRVTTVVIDQTRQRVPVVVNTGAAATNLAVFYSKRAQDHGASGVMCTPPGPGFSRSELLGYFGAISDAVAIPIVLQDTSSTPIPATMIRAIGDACANARYAKVESAPPAQQVDAAVRAAEGTVDIFGGAGGGQLLQELRRGSIGTMPFPTTTAAFAEVWNLWHAGDIATAEARFASGIAPLLAIGIASISGAHHIHKLALQKQGVIRSAYVRPPADGLDPITREELEEAFTRLGWS